MRKFIFLLLVWPAWTLCLAQPSCNEDSVLNMIGKWKKKNDANMRPYRDIAQITTRIDKISQMFQSAYSQPRGAEAEWYRTMEEYPIVEGGPIPYAFNSLYKYWYCNKNLDKLLLSGETSNWGFVFVNSLNGVLSEQYDLLKVKVDNRDVFLLPNAQGEWKGLPLYDFSSGSDGSRTVVLTHRNKVPWKSITQRQYLTALRVEWENEKKKMVAAYSKTIADTKKDIKEWQDKKDIPASFKAEMVSSLQKKLEEYEQMQKPQQEKNFKYWDDKIAVIDNYLASNPSELEKPARIERTGEQFDNFSGTFATDDNGYLLGILDPSYFDKQLPGHIPQLIVLKWRWGGNAAGLYYKKNIEENFPLDKLLGMLDK